METSAPKKIPLVIGNWKMYKTIEETVSFIKELIPKVKNSQAQIELAVPFTAIKSASEAIQGTNIAIGAQNMNDASEGAFTGEIAARMLLDAGAKFVILGHSERRRIFQETDAFIHRKLIQALKEGLQPILCVGETLEENQSGQAEKVVKNQLSIALEGVSLSSLEQVVIAYEPVWAIGTGETATPEKAQEMHHFCRTWMQTTWNQEIAQKIPVIYGGSVKPDNVKDLMVQEDIDGVLVGGASLSLESFVKIVDDSTKF